MEKLTVEKWIDDNSNCGVGSIKFSRGDIKILELIFGGNLDLYFHLINYEEPSFIPSFLISKDDYNIYVVFDKLYNDVLNANIASEMNIEESLLQIMSEFTDTNYEEELQKRKNEKVLFKAHNLAMAYKKGLIVGNTIIWRSDDYPHDIAPYFVIKKLDDAYLIDFKLPDISLVKRELDSYEKSLINDYKYGEVSVRIRNDGSSYAPFNCCFMNAFNTLMEMDEVDINQIHIEEYLYSKDNKMILERTLK
ncbi:MAG: hypothetical protein E7163_02985 [Firmicutes bacterium]|nr:hypothetical protein [Bacillota bacterium]